MFLTVDLKQKETARNSHRHKVNGSHTYSQNWQMLNFEIFIKCEIREIQLIYKLKSFDIVNQLDLLAKKILGF